MKCEFCRKEGAIKKEIKTLFFEQSVAHDGRGPGGYTEDLPDQVIRREFDICSSCGEIGNQGGVLGFGDGFGSAKVKFLIEGGL